MVVGKEPCQTDDATNDRTSSEIFGYPLAKGDFTQRPMSMRKFLEPFDHNSLTDADAGEKYAAYKASYARQRLEEYFERNKMHAWFREKYHPDHKGDESLYQKLIEHRLSIFMELYRDGLLDKLCLTSGRELDLVKLLDIVAIKLAGGTDEDIKLLDSLYHSKQSNRRPKPQLPNTSSENIKDGTSFSEPKQNRVKENTKNSSLMTKKERDEEDAEDSSHSGSSSESEDDSQSDESSSSSAGDDSTGSTSDGESSGTSSDGSDSDSVLENRGSKNTNKTGTRRRKSQHRSTSSSGRSSNSISRKRRTKGPAIQLTNSPVNRKTEEQSELKTTLDVITAEVNSEQSTTIGKIKNSPPQSSQQNPQLSTTSRLPIHCTSLLFMPHIPFSIYKKDLIALFSTCPHFLRLAILDPIIMPKYKSSTGMNSDSIFGTSPTIMMDSTKPNILLRRIGWVTFSSQVKRTDDTEQWVDVDLESIKSRILKQVIDAEAPSDLIECIRLSHAIEYHLIEASLTDRIRSNSYLMEKLLQTSPHRLLSKSLLRRHLVLAARLIYELDKARGLWSEKPASHMQTAEHTSLEMSPAQTAEKLDQSCLNESNDKSMDVNNSMGQMVDDSSENLQFVNQSMDKSKIIDNASADSVKENVYVQNDGIDFDPGDDLLKAATILSGLTNRNPLLQGLTDYLVDEGNAEEELLLSGSIQTMSLFPTSTDVNNDVTNTAMDYIHETDDNGIVNALDRLILYLRIVHSVDFYAPALYNQEDFMPHPCRIMHVRPNENDINKALAHNRRMDHISKINALDQTFAIQLRRLIRLVVPLKASECRDLGLRDPDEVVEAFIKANTRRKKRKTDVIWVCPLSNKKFRDPIFVKKHILNKHMEKVEAVKKDEALFFNNYILDPARPQLPLEPRIHKRRSRTPAHSPDRRESSLVESRKDLRSSFGSDRAGSWTRGPNHQRQRFYPQTRNRSEIYPTKDSFQTQSGFMGRSYPRPPFQQFKMPFGSQRSRFNGPNTGYGNYMRRGNQRRSYVDLDAP